MVVKGLPTATLVRNMHRTFFPDLSVYKFPNKIVVHRKDENARWLEIATGVGG